jgi:hypothetical protein
MNINVKTKTKNQTPNYYFFQPELPYIGFFIFLTNKCLCRWWSLCRQESTSKDKIWLQERYNRILYRWHNYHRRLTYFCIKVSIYSSLYCRRKQKKKPAHICQHRTTTTMESPKQDKQSFELLNIKSCCASNNLSI